MSLQFSSSGLLAFSDSRGPIASQNIYSSPILFDDVVDGNGTARIHLSNQIARGRCEVELYDKDNNLVYSHSWNENNVSGVALFLNATPGEKSVPLRGGIWKDWNVDPVSFATGKVVLTKSGVIELMSFGEYWAGLNDRTNIWFQKYSSGHGVQTLTIPFSVTTI